MISFSLSSCANQVDPLIDLSRTSRQLSINPGGHLECAISGCLIQQVTLANECHEQCSGHDKTEHKGRNGDDIHVSSQLTRRYASLRS